MTDPQDDRPPGPPFFGLADDPKTLAIVVGTFTLILGIPIALFIHAGRWDAVAGLLVLFAGMVTMTAVWLKNAVEIGQSLEDDGKDGGFL